MTQRKQRRTGKVASHPARLQRMPAGMVMRIIVVGSAAGGGVPQWNCNYRISRAARDGSAGVTPRTQSSLAVSAGGDGSVGDPGWVLINASPDIRQQIAATPELQPAASGPLRNSPIRAVVLTNADVDHVAGLLSLRERQGFALYASRQVLAALAANPIFGVLDPDLVPRRELIVPGSTEILDERSRPTGVAIETFAVPGKVALYLEDASRPDADFRSETGDTIGVRLAAPGGSAFYIPGCARVDDSLRRRVAGAACLLFDGTVFTDDEMPAAGLGAKTGARMGHLHMSGPDGSMARWEGVEIERRIFVHINGSNPVLDEASAEHAAVRAAGWEVARDGLEIVL